MLTRSSSGCGQWGECVYAKQRGVKSSGEMSKLPELFCNYSTEISCGFRECWIFWELGFAGDVGEEVSRWQDRKRVKRFVQRCNRHWCFIFGWFVCRWMGNQSWWAITWCLLYRSAVEMIKFAHLRQSSFWKFIFSIKSKRRRHYLCDVITKLFLIISLKKRSISFIILLWSFDEAALGK